jgi:hypothetical protein
VPRSPAPTLISAGFLVVLVPFDVCGFRLERARGGHAAQCLDRLLRRSFRVPWPSAVRLVRASFLVGWVPLDVRGSRLVLAREWHAASWHALSAWELACHAALTHELAGQLRFRLRYTAKSRSEALVCGIMAVDAESGLSAVVLAAPLVRWSLAVDVVVGGLRCQKGIR